MTAVPTSQAYDFDTQRLGSRRPWYRRGVTFLAVTLLMVFRSIYLGVSTMFKKRMSLTACRIVTSLALGLLMNAVASAATITGQVGGLVPPDSRPCAFFSIVGVNEADPVKPGWPWIAVPQGQNGFKELYALLLSAKLSGLPITVNTTGIAVANCDGYVGVTNAYYFSP